MLLVWGLVAFVLSHLSRKREKANIILSFLLIKDVSTSVIETPNSFIFNFWIIKA